jgi:phenylpropionate dioxygenase-like ring-hydroxylating dioxygenase large terminal subunit
MLRLNGYWYIAAAAADLGRRPLRRAVEGETLVLFRDAAGRSHALLDRCAHRGMALSHGRVVGDCVECPYHGWQYDGTGALRAVPALCAGETLPQPKGMRAFAAAESDGQVWVWVGQGQPSGPPFHFPRCGEAGWSTFFMHTRFAAPVEACLENFLDVPHTLFVHPGLFRGREQRPTRAQMRRDADSVEAVFLDERRLEGFGPRLLFPRGTTLRHIDRFVLPSITTVEYAFGGRHAFLITSQCTQRVEYVVDVTTALTWRLPVPRWLARPFLRFYCRRVIQQDVAILKVQGEQMRRFGPAYTSTAADLLGRHIRGLRRQAAEGGQPAQDGAEVGTETVLMM